MHIHRLLSQAVSEEVCKFIKNLVDAQAKTRKLVRIVTALICSLARCSAVLNRFFCNFFSITANGLFLFSVFICEHVHQCKCVSAYVRVVCVQNANVYVLLHNAVDTLPHILDHFSLSTGCWI